MRAIKQNGINQGYLFSGKMNVYEELPLSEYPRPQMVRDSFVSLHGLWDLSISKSKELPRSYDKKVQVPFPLEALDSGVKVLPEPGDYIFYHRIVMLPDNFKKKEIIIHFEGVDQEATVFIDRKEVLTHVGMYEGFDVVLSDKTPKMFDLVIRVRDLSDQNDLSRGKQSLQPKFFTYTTTTGIFRPVWMESVEENYIKSVRYDVDHKLKKLCVYVETKNKTTLKFYVRENSYEIVSNQWSELTLDEIHYWSIEDPYLYDCKIEIPGLDEVSSYFAFRQIETREKDGRSYMYLNGKPLFLSGLLDQGYYGYNNLTPVRAKEYERDIVIAKEMGFNCLRVHVTILPEIFYYYADKLGMLLIQDFPNGGDKVPLINVAKPVVFPCLNDEKKTNEKQLGRTNERGKEEFIQMMKGCSQRLSSHPSIIIYTIFNEGWGQFDASHMYEQLKKEIKDCQLIDTTSGWYEAEKSDFFSIHTYYCPKMKRKNRYHHCYIISECGGVSKKPENAPYDKISGHGKVKSKQKLMKKIEKLYLKDLLPQIKDRGLSGFIYTQIADVETEYCGLYDLTRSECKVDVKKMQELNATLYQAFADMF